MECYQKSIVNTHSIDMFSATAAIPSLETKSNAFILLDCIVDGFADFFQPSFTASHPFVSPVVDNSAYTHYNLPIPDITEKQVLKALKNLQKYKYKYSRFKQYFLFLTYHYVS